MGAFPDREVARAAAIRAAKFAPSWETVGAYHSPLRAKGNSIRPSNARRMTLPAAEGKVTVLLLRPLSDNECPSDQDCAGATLMPVRYPAGWRGQNFMAG